MADYTFSSAKWPGIAKLLEEAAEVIQVCGKIIGVEGQPNHWDGTVMKRRLEEELGDLRAAIMFVEKVNDLDTRVITQQALRKLQTFKSWRHQCPCPCHQGVHTPPFCCADTNRVGW
jgi:NTP pyrophosphatase (non-canonical NTP hydrolase)